MSTALRNRDFALLWTGGLVSEAGDWMLFTALPFFVFARTGSALAASATFAVFYVPYLLFGAVAGVFVDRWDRRITMLVCDALRTGLMLLLLFGRSADTIWIVYIVLFCERSLGTLFEPAKGALIPSLVGERELLAANSLSQVSDNVARIVAPSIGGFLLAGAGLGAVVIADSASYLVSALCIALVSVRGSSPRLESSAATASSAWNAAMSEMLEGLREIGRERWVAMIFLVVGLAVLADSALTGLIVPFSNQILRLSAQQFGWLITARGAGGLAGALAIGIVAHRVSPAWLLATSLGCLTVLFAVLFNTQLFWLALLCIGLAGLPAAGWNASERTILQTHVPDELRGRVLAALGTELALVGLCGITLAGSLGAPIGITPILNTSAVVTGISAAICAFMIYRYNMAPQRSM